ncbi:hypothetical protein [Peribacillus sp.]|uniref:hypothetical protein n=1 Tax=Peribacillus sp. TaxID=2675267 RepID=UPI00388F68ED
MKVHVPQAGFTARLLQILLHHGYPSIPHPLVLLPWSPYGLRTHLSQAYEKRPISNKSLLMVRLFL